MTVCPHLKGKFIIWTHVHTFNMHVHKLKYRSLKYGFLLKNQELLKSDSIKDFNLEGSLWLSSIQQKNLCFTIDSVHRLCQNIIYEILTHSSMKTMGKCRLFSRSATSSLMDPFHKATQPKNQHCLWFLYSKHDHEWISCFLCFN